MIETCSVLNTTNFIGKKWTLLIFLELHKGNTKWKRYNQLLKRLKGITPKILSQRLKEMQENGLITKKEEDTKPKTCSYSLTSCGQDLIKITTAYKDWVLKWKTCNKKWKKICTEQDCEKCEF